MAMAGDSISGTAVGMYLYLFWGVFAMEHQQQPFKRKDAFKGGL